MRQRLWLAVVLFATCRLSADSWYMPKPEVYHSANRRWRLVTTPRQIKGQLEYFQDKVAGNPNPGAVEDGGVVGPQGELFFETGGGTWRRFAQWRLVNEVAPVSALVANDGTVVTFDNWHAMGYGDDVVVIYRPDGTLVRKLGLSNLLDEEGIRQLRHSVSSIWWSGTHRLEERKRLLLLEIDAHPRETVPVSLDTGAVLAPRR